MSNTTIRMEDLPHYTYDDYVQWEGKWEIIKGIPYAMAPAPVINHQRIFIRLVQQLGVLLGNCGNCEVLASVDWQIEEDTVVQPDALIVCYNHIEDVGEKKLEELPVIVFEILSPSTSRKDKITKYRLYENAGVKYYCMVDPLAKSVEVFTLNAGEASYQPAEPEPPGIMDFNLPYCGNIKFNFNDIFPQS